LGKPYVALPQAQYEALMADNERLRKALTRFLTLFPNTIGDQSSMGEALLEAHSALAVRSEAAPFPTPRPAAIDPEEKT
jgi:hypothetical protein